MSVHGAKADIANDCVQSECDPKRKSAQLIDSRDWFEPILCPRFRGGIKWLEGHGGTGP